MADAREAPCGTKHSDYRDLIATCDALVATHTTAEIVACSYFRGHPVVCFAGEACSLRLMGRIRVSACSRMSRRRAAAMVWMSRMC